jgi:hypothetical protein
LREKISGRELDEQLVGCSTSAEKRKEFFLKIVHFVAEDE